jgi:hypothetical protein
MGKPKLAWADKLSSDDVKSSEGFLTLKYSEKAAEEIGALFQSAEVVMHRADDILRACGLHPLPVEDIGVRKYLVKLLTPGSNVPPVMIMNGAWMKGPMIVQGYHRTCATYWLDPDAEVACVIITSGGGNED